MTEKIFVYGTLMKRHIGSVNIVGEGEMCFVGNGKIEGELYDLGGYPGAVEKNGTYVYGEVIEVKDSDVIRRLDEYEEFDHKNPKNSLFIRRRLKVTMARGKTVSAFVYLYNGSIKGLRKIASGRWKESVNLESGLQNDAVQ
jgi:gamma-glutamylcyclotransferase (GGCT)/AIG2-like uncharacterized protein YtfP